MSLNWDLVAQAIEMESANATWCYGQDRTLRAVAKRLRIQPGVLIADDVGLGKTRVALAVVRAVISQGGTAAVLAPPGLLYQWEQEWREYAREGEPPSIIRSFDQCVLTAGRRWPLLSAIAVDGKKRPWGLFSHRFGIPSLQENSRPVRFGIPAIALALLRVNSAPRGFRNTSLWRFASDLAGDCLLKTCGKLECQRCDLVAAAQFLVAFEDGRLLSTLDESKIIHPSLAKPYLTQVWRKTFLELMRAMVGAVDLVVIDEAHKSRDDNDAESMLGELSRRIVPTRGKRLALTATPVELAPEQWKDVLERIGVSAPPMRLIKEFGAALQQAQRHPDQAKAIHGLLEASRSFQEGLRPHVIRRRRISQEEMKKLVGDMSGAHPHRAQNIIRIPYSAIIPSWRPVVLALEGLGKAAKGSGVKGGAVRTADIRYASGHIGDTTLDDEADLVEGSRTSDAEDPTGKLKRIAYWRRVAKGGLRADPANLGAHPRVSAVAGRLDGILHASGSKEKVLVFGVFTKPLRALVESLNRRAMLRMLDQGLPFPIANAESEAALIWSEYSSALLQVAAGLPGALGYSQLLSQPLANVTALRRMLVDAHRNYRRLRASLQRSLARSFLDKLPGDAAIHRLDDEDQESLLELLRGRIVNERIGAGTLPSEPDGFDREEVQQRTMRIWIDEFLHPCRDRDSEESHDETGSRSQWDGDSGFAVLDRVGDALDERRLQRLIRGEVESGLGRFSSFSRLLIGNTQAETRRSLQAQFNRSDSFPRVLVAQSRVGREGLNLHTACSRVMLFNAEWNPGVMEQQVGRVDRIESLWERATRDWKQNGSVGPMPKIEIEHVLFEGTYDEYQWSVVDSRQRGMRAQLHGELLDDVAMAQVPEDLRAAVASGAPDFEP